MVACAGDVCPHAVQLEHVTRLLEQALARIEELEQQLRELQRQHFGPKSERLPPMGEELREHEREHATEEEREQRQRERARATQQRRREHRAEKKQLETRTIFHPVPPDQRRCPSCGSTDLRALGPGRVTALYERLAEKFERQEHVQEVLTCRCGEGIVTAEPPPKLFDKAQYGPNFVANLVVSKTTDSMPLYRQEKRCERQGLPMSRSTMVEHFHRAAELVRPISERLLELVADRKLVQTDETTMPVLAPGKTQKGALWTFLSPQEGELPPIITYAFSLTKGKEVPQSVLAETLGFLVADAAKVFNVVVLPTGRIRAGCLAHARRKFFDALPKSPEAREALDLIRELYAVEAEAERKGVLQGPEHLKLRQEKSAPIVRRFEEWLEQEAPKHLPKGPLGIAINYVRNNWRALTKFLEDAMLPLDNNASERALRIAAVGRKNFLFVGHEQAGRNLAGLYSLVATCQANDVNPEEYLADVLIRVQTHPNKRLDELLPWNWVRLFGHAKR